MSRKKKTKIIEYIVCPKIRTLLSCENCDLNRKKAAIMDKDVTAVWAPYARICEKCPKSFSDNLRKYTLQEIQNDEHRKELDEASNTAPSPVNILVQGEINLSTNVLISTAARKNQISD
jgi:hypothetical protein